MCFASKKEEMQIEYNLQLVQHTFLKAFETGLRDKGLVTTLRPILHMCKISNEVLMRSVNDAASVQPQSKSKA